MAHALAPHVPAHYLLRVYYPMRAIVISRRSFVARLAGGTAALAGAPTLLLASRADADIVLRNGTLFDGLGGPGREMDVAILQGRIVAVGPRLRLKGSREIDVRGLAVAPGFVDIHSHGDGSLSADPRAESLVRQGITTIVVGADGGSRFPRLTTAGGMEPFAALWTQLSGIRPAVNVASMVGLGTVRGLVVGEQNRVATPEELGRMVALVEQALADGACGASTGLEYAPGAFATREELAALCRPLARRGLA